jgi:hypothetical protein
VPFLLHMNLTAENSPVVWATSVERWKRRAPGAGRVIVTESSAARRGLDEMRAATQATARHTASRFNDATPPSALESHDPTVSGPGS